MHEDRFDDDARRFLWALGDDPVPPSRLDGATLLRAGRRRLRVRRVTRVGMAAVVTGALLAAVPFVWRNQPPPSESASPTSCAPQLLALPPGADSGRVTNGDPSGRYLVGAVTGGGRAWTVLWDHGTPQLLSPPISEHDHLAVNGAGTVAGSGSNLGWVYRDGKYSTLLAPGGKPAGRIEIDGINERGDIVGTAAETPLERGKPVVWPGGDPAAGRYLAATANPGDAFVTDIDDDGTVIGGQGFSEQGEHRRVALVWAPNGHVKELSVPPEWGPNQETTVIRHGWVGGGYADPLGQTGRKVGVGRWKDGVFEGLPMGVVHGINARGWVAGLGRNGIRYDAAIYTDRLIILSLPPGPPSPSRVPMPSGTPLMEEATGPMYGEALSVSDDGHTVGGHIFFGPFGSERPAMWSCR
jgi:hypothetical protein